MNAFCKEQFVIDVTGWTDKNKAALRQSVESFNLATADEPTHHSKKESERKPDLLDELLMRLMKAGAAVQYAVIQRAIENGGEVSRDEVYDLGDYADDRSLKGFTRPVRRIAKVMVSEGIVPPEVVDGFFAPIYDPKVKSFQRTKGFRVNVDVLKAA